MMKKILKLEIFGFLVCAVLGSLLHFVYKWTGENSIIGLFVPVNESPWEHLKLIYLPYVLYGVYEAIKLTNDKFNVYFSKLVGLICGIITTLGIYYISLGATGKNIDVINILSYFVGIGVAYIISYIIINKSIGKGMINTISCIILILIGIMFMFFTYFPPKIPLFQDPQNFKFGIEK